MPCRTKRRASRRKTTPGQKTRQTQGGNEIGIEPCFTGEENIELVCPVCRGDLLKKDPEEVVVQVLYDEEGNHKKGDRDKYEETLPPAMSCVSED